MERVIIAGVDGSASGRAAADWAAREALRRRLPLRVVHVSPDGTTGAADQTVAELTGRHPALTARSVHLTGAAAPVLRSLTGHAELLVVGLDEEGTTGPAVAAACACPVVLVPALAPLGDSGPVVVAVDARDPDGGTLGFAFEAARRGRAPLRAVHSWTLPPDATELPLPVSDKDRATWEDQEVLLLSDALRPWHGKYPDIDVRQDVVLLPPAEALVHASESAGLVVVGHRSGATARAVLGHAYSPVAVVP